METHLDANLPYTALLLLVLLTHLVLVSKE